MAEQEVSVKVTTEISKASGDFLIHCFSDENEDGTTRPSIFKSQVPIETKIVDNVEVKEGELALSYKGGDCGELNPDGELIIYPEDDDADRYEIQDQNLMYNE